MARFEPSSRAVASPRPTGARRRAAVIGGAAAALALLGGAGTAAAAGDSCPNAAIRAAQRSEHLPDCRAYEWVSWENPGGYDAGVDQAARPRNVFVRADGEKLTYFSTGPIGDATRGPVNMQSLADRTATGWRSRAGMSLTSPETVSDALTTTQANVIPSLDFSVYGFAVGRSLGPPNPVAGRSLYLSSGPGTEEWVNEPEVGVAPAAMTGAIIGGTPDFSTVYFISNRALTTQAGDDTRTGIGLYQRTNGIVRPAGVLPDGTVPQAGVRLSGSGASLDTGVKTNTELLKRRGQVSEDGRRVFFVATDGGASQLYVREDGARTRLLSHALGSARTPSAEGVEASNVSSMDYGQKGSAYATLDGSQVLFRSRGVLAAGADSVPAGDVKTYRADVATGALTYLPEVQGDVMMVDGDASRIMWEEKLAPRGRTLWIWDGDTNTRRLVNTIAERPGTWEYAWLGTTADGSTWAMQSKIPLDPDFPDTGGTFQVYRWEIGDASPTCISCQVGATYVGPAQMTPFSTSPAETIFLGNAVLDAGQQLQNRALSADGRRVIFDTRTPLVGEDVDDGRDVYLWQEGRGVSLITDGEDPEPTYFFDASASGDDIFFTTMSNLVPEDRDGSFDIYTAHVDGGFAAAPEATCDGDGCQPPAEPRLPTSASGSDQVGETVRGPDALAHAPAQLVVKRVKRDRTGARIRIALSSAGTVRIGGPRVATVRRKLARRGAVTVRLRLRRAARRTLARRGKVAVRVRVRFAPRTGKAVATTVRTTIKRKKR